MKSRDSLVRLKRFQAEEKRRRVIQIEAMVAETESKVGPIDIFCSNAGILRDAIFHRMDPDEWRAVIDVHLHGSFNISRAAATAPRR